MKTDLQPRHHPTLLSAYNKLRHDLVAHTF